MKKIAIAVALLSILLGVFAVVRERLGEGGIVWGSLKVSTGQLLLVAVILAMVAILLKFYSAGESRKIIARDARIFFWIVGLVILGTLVSLGLGAGRQLSHEEIVEQFYKVYYSPERLKTTFLGVASLQYPTDNWAMQELITELKPDFIVETGTNAGGTALFYATILEKLNDNSKVITVDVGEHDPAVLKFPTWKERVEFIRGSSVSDEVFEKIRARVQGRKVLVTLDSLHTKDHVLREMKLYSHLVSLNSYMVVQDTQLMGHPIPLAIYTHEGKEGPWQAVQAFMTTDGNFAIDRSRERFLLTANPSGFLKRVK
jgi:cephalosporin hydroxylase